MTEKIIPVFAESLDISFKGMAALFLFMFIFYLLIIAVDRLLPHKEEKK